MNPRSPDRAEAQNTPFTSALRIFTTAAALAAAVYYVSFSIHWRLSIDSPVMHYVIFLLRHGLRPYTQITDNNMPGAYLTEAVAMRLFGGGDVGWRVYEFVLLGLMALAMASLSRRVDPVAGVFAATIFLALHASEGPQLAAERELVVTVLLLLAAVATFAAVERRRPPLMFAMGLLGGLASSIKPTFVFLAIALLGIATVELRRRRISIASYVASAFGGLLLVAGACFGFLLWHHAVHGFVFVLTRVIPAYAGLQPQPWSLVLSAAMPRSLLALTAVAVPLAAAKWRREGRWTWQHYALLLCAAFGLLSFLAQRKGFPHHRYTFLSFLLLIAAIEFFKALRAPGWPRVLAAFAILFALLGFVPRSLRTGAAIPAGSEFYTSLDTDLQSLGGGATLQRKVFCFDLVYGCLNVLYHQKLVESSGFTGDLLFFPTRANPATDFYRQQFWSDVGTNPPDVLVVSNEDLLQPTNSFTRIDRWPDLANYIASGFTQVTQRTFPHEKFGVYQGGTLDPRDMDAYRIFIRNGSPLLRRIAALRASSSPGR